MFTIFISNQSNGFISPRLCLSISISITRDICGLVLIRICSIRERDYTGYAKVRGRVIKFPTNILASTVAYCEEATEF